MHSSPVPWFVLAPCYLTGAIIIALGVPLLRKRVPPNWLYGVRFPATMADERVWYAINARGGRDLILIGSFYIALQTLFLFAGAKLGAVAQVLVPLALVMIAVLADAVVLGVAASRLLATLRQNAPPGAS